MSSAPPRGILGKKQGSGSGRSWVLDRGYADFREHDTREVRRTPFSCRWVNRVASDALRAYDKPVIQHPVLYDTDLPDDP
jgi:hypothetical protein